MLDSNYDDPRQPAPLRVNGFFAPWRRESISEDCELWVPRGIRLNWPQRAWYIELTHNEGIHKDVIGFGPSFNRTPNEALNEAITRLRCLMNQLASPWSVDERNSRPGGERIIDTGFTGVELQVQTGKSLLNFQITVICLQSIKAQSPDRSGNHSTRIMTASVSRDDYVADPQHARTRLIHGIQTAVAIRRAYRRHRANYGTPQQIVRMTDTVEGDAPDTDEITLPAQLFARIEHVENARLAKRPVIDPAVFDVTMLMSGFEGHPLVDGFLYHKNPAQRLTLADYPSLRAFLLTMGEGAMDDWQALIEFAVAAKETGTFSNATMNRYLGEATRVLLYLWLIERSSLANIELEPALDRFIDFLQAPPESWCAREPNRCFRFELYTRMPVSGWRPLRQSLSPQSAIGCVKVARNALRHLMVHHPMDASPGTLR